MLRVAAQLATEHPRLVFRNPEKVALGGELQHKQRALFIEFFGTDLVVVSGGGGFPPRPSHHPGRRSPRPGAQPAPATASGCW